MESFQEHWSTFFGVGMNMLKKLDEITYPAVIFGQQDFFSIRFIMYYIYYIYIIYIS